MSSVGTPSPATRTVTPNVISANRLDDGIVVFVDSAGAWVEGLQQAHVFEDAAALAAAVAKAQADVAANVVVDVAPFEVTLSAGHIRANHIRDAIRAAGPTVHRDHGKQAVGL